MFRIGAEVTVSVNGVPIKIYPAARLVAEGKVESKSGGCLSGYFSAGIGLDAGVSADFSVPNPGDLLGTACIGLVSGICSTPKVKVANCVVKEIAGVNPCKKVGLISNNLLFVRIKKVVDILQALMSKTRFIIVFIDASMLVLHS